MYVSYPALASDVKAGDDVFLSDGIIHLKVESVEGRNVRCRIVHGGMLTSRKGLNLPGVRLSTPAVTEKDLSDLAFGLDMGVDFVALSFVSTAADVERVKDLITAKRAHALVVSKIERREALANLDRIIEASDAVMVARGDLGVEIPPEEVPIVQKTIVAKCRERGKPVIIATQMLESMVSVRAADARGCERYRQCGHGRRRCAHALRGDGDGAIPRRERRDDEPRDRESREIRERDSFSRGFHSKPLLLPAASPSSARAPSRRLGMRRQRR